MRKRQKVTDVKLMSVNHKINRKQMIQKELDYFYKDLADPKNSNFGQTLKTVDRLEDAFLETVKTPVGGYVARFICL